MRGEKSEFEFSSDVEVPLAEAGVSVEQLDDQVQCIAELPSSGTDVRDMYCFETEFVQVKSERESKEEEIEKKEQCELSSASGDEFDGDGAARTPEVRESDVFQRVEMQYESEKFGREKEQSCEKENENSRSEEQKNRSDESNTDYERRVILSRVVDTEQADNILLGVAASTQHDPGGLELCEGSNRDQHVGLTGQEERTDLGADGPSPRPSRAVPSIQGSTRGTMQSRQRAMHSNRPSAANRVLKLCARARSQVRATDASSASSVRLTVSTSVLSTGSGSDLSKVVEKSAEILQAIENEEISADSREKARGRVPGDALEVQFESGDGDQQQSDDSSDSGDEEDGTSCSEQEVEPQKQVCYVDRPEEQRASGLTSSVSASELVGMAPLPTDDERNVALVIGGVRVRRSRVLMDTGARDTVISPLLYLAMDTALEIKYGQRKPLIGHNCNLYSFTRNSVPCKGMTQTEMWLPGGTTVITDVVHVSECVDMCNLDVLLGRSSMRPLGIKLMTPQGQDIMHRDIIKGAVIPPARPPPNVRRAVSSSSLLALLNDRFQTQNDDEEVVFAFEPKDDYIGPAEAISVPLRQSEHLEAARFGEVSQMAAPIVDVDEHTVRFTEQAEAVSEGDMLFEKFEKVQRETGDGTKPFEWSREEFEAEFKLPDHLPADYSREFMEMLWGIRFAFSSNARGSSTEGVSNLGKCAMATHKIKLTTDVPVKVPIRRVPPGRRAELEKLIEELVRNGCIEESDSPFRSALVLIKKRDNSLRVCTDFRQLNDVTVADEFPMPIIDDVLEMMAGATVYSTVDIKAGFYNLEIEPEDRPKTAFEAVGRLYQWRVMPMGLKNAPATFNRVMSKILRPHIGVRCCIYCDDVAIFSKDKATHIEDVRLVLKTIGDVGMRFNPAKCSFAQKSLKFLGHVVSPEGITADPEKVRALVEFELPKTKDELWRFVGLAQYLQKYYRMLSTSLEPLNKLLHSLPLPSSKVPWTPELIACFEKVKAELAAPALLQMPRQGFKFWMVTDASAVGIGAALGQVVHGVNGVIAFASRACTKTEQKMDATSLEALAVMFGGLKFWHYLIAGETEVWTDHLPLVHIWKKPLPNNRYERWALSMQALRITLKYVKGKENVLADALSRAPLPRPPEIPDTEPSEVVDVQGRRVEYVKREERVCPTKRGAKTEMVSAVIGLSEMQGRTAWVRELVTVDEQTAQEMRAKLVEATPEASRADASARHIEMRPNERSATSSNVGSAQTADRAQTSEPDGCVACVLLGDVVCPVPWSEVSVKMPLSVEMLESPVTCSPDSVVWMTQPQYSRTGLLRIVGYDLAETMVGDVGGECGMSFSNELRPSKMVIEELHDLGEIEERELAASTEHGADSWLTAVVQTRAQLSAAAGEEQQHEHLQMAKALARDAVENSSPADEQQQASVPNAGEGKIRPTLDDWQDILQARDNEDEMVRQLDKEAAERAPYEGTKKVRGLVRLTTAEARREVLEEFHAGEYAGHPGADKLHGLLEKFYCKQAWPSMRADCLKWVQQCNVCRMRGAGMVERLPLCTRPPPERPMQYLSTDFCTMRPDSAYPYMCVMIDHFSRFAMATACRQQSSQQAKRLAEQVFRMFGVPERVRSDNHSVYVSREYSGWLESLGVEHDRSTPYSKTSNGMVERVLRTLQLIGSKMIQADQRVLSTWHVQLPAILQAYNTGFHKVLGCSPYKVLFGVEYTRKPGLVDPNPAMSEFWRDIQKRLILAVEVNKRNFKKPRDKKETSFKPGDLCFVKDAAAQGMRKVKLDCPFSIRAEVISVDRRSARVKTEDGVERAVPVEFLQHRYERQE